MPRERIRKAVESAQVDGDKNQKKTGGYESKMRMDDMAIEWVEQVLSFLPLTDVYKCKSVCKEWHVAADRVLSDWEKLVIEMEDDDNGTSVILIADKNQIFLQNDPETWIKRLKQLVRLKKVFINGNYFGSEIWGVGDDVVLRNALTVTTLHMSSKRLPFDPNRPVVFCSLRELECSRMDPDQAAACPRLEKLRTSTSPGCLQKLAAETLTSLRIDGLEFETGSPEEIGQLVAALSRLSRLKRLILDCRRTGGIRYFWTELHDLPFIELFTNMKELCEVDITFAHRIVVDVAIETLVNNSLSVRSIRMHNARMTDAGLLSLSRLTGLQHLAIRGLGRRSNITTEGILSLLRGKSRNVLRYLKLSTSVSPDWEQIRAEGQLMRQETGRSLSIAGNKAHDMHHNFKIAIRGVLKRPFP